MRELSTLAERARAEAHEIASQEARTFDATAALAGLATAVLVYYGAARHLAPRQAGTLLCAACCAPPCGCPERPSRRGGSCGAWRGPNYRIKMP